MERQTFAKLLLPVLPSIVRLTAIKGLDGWPLARYIVRFDTNRHAGFECAPRNALLRASG